MNTSPTWEPIPANITHPEFIVVCDPIIVFKESRCHRFQGGFEPEPGSRLYAEAITIREKMIPKKFHWAGSACSHVRGPVAYLAMDRTVGGWEFDRLPQNERCKCCDRQFQVA